MIAVPPSAIRDALGDLLREFWSLDHNASIGLVKRPLQEKAEEVSEQLLKGILDVHPLQPIIRHALHDITDHATAIDVLGKTKTALLHVRHIEELFTVCKFLISIPERYNEFAWRWTNFKTLHWIRNRILNLKQPLDPNMKEWIKGNLEQMRTYFSKKFDEDESKCIPQWEKLSNWLQGIPLIEIFDKAGRLGSYKTAAYDWNSQSVHMSPLSNEYMGYELEHQDYGDFAIDSAKTFIHKMCSECLPLVVKQDELRKYYCLQVLLEAYGLLCEKPNYYIYLANKQPRYAAFTNIVLKKPHDLNAIMTAAIGAQPKDPLLLNFSTEGKPLEEQ